MNRSPSKTELRAAARANRARLAAASPRFGETIARHAKDFVLPARGPVASYWPMRDEADPRALAAALAIAGHAILLPRLEGREAPMAFRHWRDGDQTELNAHGVPEPLTTAQAGTPAAILVPLLAFDRDGYRLGYGGGYYDRTLSTLRAASHVLAIGIAYAGQELDTPLGRDPHDERLDMVVTENGVRSFPGKRTGGS